MPANANSPIDILEDNALLWWFGAIAFFLVGDIVTTLIGLQLRTIVEANPLAESLISSYGVGVIFPLKVLIVVGFYAAYRLVPAPHRIGVPLGLCLLGFVITVWNGAVIMVTVM